MAGTHDLRVEKLFSVKDYVCVITGGGYATNFLRHVQWLSRSNV